jgi:phosphoesterase RecJ-like protein
MGKEVFVVNENKPSDRYKFLPGMENILTLRKFTNLKLTPEAAFVFDCSEPERMGKISDIVLNLPVIVNIDHHFDNKNFGTINWVNDKYSSVGEMCYLLMSRFDKIDKNIAVCLYTSILFDTGSFHYHFGEKTFHVAGELLKSGIDPEEISDKIYYQKPIKVIKLMTMMLETLVFDENLQLAWTKITEDMFKKTKTTEEDTEGLIDVIRAIKGADMVFLMKERKNAIKVSMRSKNRYNVYKIAENFGGGGHRKAAAFSFTGISLKEAEKVLIGYIRKKWKDLSI